MIRYNQTVNNLENLEIELPKITGYKKQFSIEIPRGKETEKTEETSVVENQQPILQQKQPQIVTPNPLDFSETEMNVLLNDGSSKDKSKVASKYLQKNLGLSKDQAAALIGV